MAKISGNISADARLIIVNESDWTVESNTTETGGAFEISGLTAGAKTVISRAASGECDGYGGVGSIVVPFTDYSNFKFWDLTRAEGCGMIDGKFIFSDNGYMDEGEYIPSTYRLWPNDDFRTQLRSDGPGGASTQTKLVLTKNAPSEYSPVHINYIKFEGMDSSPEEPPSEGAVRYPIAIHDWTTEDPPTTLNISVGSAEVILDLDWQQGVLPFIGNMFEFDPVGPDFTEWRIDQLEFDLVDGNWITAPYWRSASYRGQDKWAEGSNTWWYSQNNGMWRMVVSNSSAPAYLNVTGSWATGFRPQRMLVCTTWTSGDYINGGYSLDLLDSADNIIVSNSNPSNKGYKNFIFDLTEIEWPGDIAKLKLGMATGGDEVDLYIREIIFEY